MFPSHVIIPLVDWLSGGTAGGCLNALVILGSQGKLPPAYSILILWSRQSVSPATLHLVLPGPLAYHNLGYHLRLPS